MSEVRKAFFCYEFHSVGRIPVVYYDEPPFKSVNGGTNSYTVPIPLLTSDSRFFSEEASPRFSALVEAFPYEALQT